MGAILEASRRDGRWRGRRGARECRRGLRSGGPLLAPASRFRPGVLAPAGGQAHPSRAWHPQGDRVHSPPKEGGWSVR